MKSTEQTGFGLLDALIGVGILAAGVLVLLAAVNRAQANARELRETQIANLLLHDLAERLHLNQHLSKAAVATLYSHTLGASLPADIDCSASPCDATALAQHDMHTWGQAVATQLPEGQFALVSGADVVTVMLSWQPRGNIATPGLDTGLDQLVCPTDRRCLLTHIRP